MKLQNGVSLVLPHWVSFPLVWIQHATPALGMATVKHLEDLIVQTFISYFQLLCSYFDSSVTLNGLQLHGQKLLTALLTSVFACSDFLQVWIKIAVWGKFQ